ncbi:hypothetical protein ACFLVN_04920 [Chloroflexota bacterium]
MQQDIIEVMGEYLSEDPIKWGKLASDIQWRRLQLMLLREVLLELRKLNQRLPRGRCPSQDNS